jgi:hypothetical protein
VNENTLKACMLLLMAVTIGTLGALVATGHDSYITNGLLALSGAVGGLGVWERLKK